MYAVDSVKKSKTEYSDVCQYSKADQEFLGSVLMAVEAASRISIAVLMTKNGELVVFRLFLLPYIILPQPTIVS